MTSTSPDGDPSTDASKYQNEPSNNGVDVTCLVQQMGQNYILVPSEAAPSDTNEEWNKNRGVTINQAPKGLSLTSGSEMSTSRKRFKEREHIYAEAVCSL